MPRMPKDHFRLTQGRSLTRKKRRDAGEGSDSVKSIKSSKPVPVRGDPGMGSHGPDSEIVDSMS